MSLFSAIRVALAALLINKGRSGLTSLGIVIGIGAVIAMVSAGDGAKHILDDRLDSIGKNLILIRAGARTQQGNVGDFAPLTTQDVAAIRKQVGHLLVGVAELQVVQRLAVSRHASWSTAILGCTPDMQPVRKWKLASGRFITEDDVKKQASVCCLCSTVARKLFPDNADPIGQMVQVDTLQLRVVGVCEPKGRSPTGFDQDDQLFLPITTLQRKLVGKERVEMILVSTLTADTIDQAKQEIAQVLREQHRLKKGSEDFDISSVQEMAQLAVFMMNTMQVLVAIIASISLVVGGIGIMNIMLVSVTERTREIGIRMAVGATPRDVLIQFLIESVVLALVGGMIGVSLGLSAATLLAKAAGWPVVISPMMVALACGVAASVGIFFGYYPASKASRLDPIVALRYE